MARHQPERLHVHHEVVRRPLGPAPHHLLGGQPVVRRIDLDRVEVLRVVREPFAGRRPFGYQCFESASSAQEHVPMRISVTVSA
jgi:hypothetical protein